MDVDFRAVLSHGCGKHYLHGTVFNCCLELNLHVQALAAVRELMAMLPLSNRDAVPRVTPVDPPSRVCPFLDQVVPPSDIEVRNLKKFRRQTLPFLHINYLVISFPSLSKWQRHSYVALQFELDCYIPISQII